MASAYTPEQLAAYESYVGLPAQFRSSAKPALTYDYLTALHVHQISSVPYENLLLHYSISHAVSLDPQVVFKKVVTDARGRGGYCMENTILFNHVLRGLGFPVYMAGVKIRPRVDGVPGGDYIGWVHVVNIVTLSDGSQWSVDVGFGGDGPTKPLPLIQDLITFNLGTQEVRLHRGPLPKYSNRTQEYWMYEYRNSPTHGNALYAFPGLEFSHDDLLVMNHYTSTSTSETNFQTRRVLVIRFLRSEVEVEGGKKGMRIVGKIMMVNGEVKKNMGGKTTLVQACTTEDERVRALKEYFDLELTEEEIQAVKGRNVELLLGA